MDADCSGIAGTPYCAGDGTCVACKDDSQCMADKPVCDASERACRGCAADAECSSGICLELPGTCADDGSVAFLRANGSDSGTCTRSSPCATFNYAFGQLSTTRNVIHIFGTEFSVGNNAVILPSRTLYVDGERTEIRRDLQGPVFTSTFGGSAILSHATIGATAYQNEALNMSAGSVELYDVAIPTKLTVTGGTLEISHSTLEFPTNNSCSTGGTINVHDSLMKSGGFLTTDCNVTLERDRLTSTGSTLTGSGSGALIVENNVIVSTDFFTDAMHLNGGAGSKVRFNTFVNLSGVDMGGVSLTCNANTDATSNIVAWHSGNPPGCALRYSLFDNVVGLQPGMGNLVGDASTFFVDLENGDFRLAATSPARGAGESGVDVMSDIEGNGRPKPSGSQPDIGAYEAP